VPGHTQLAVGSLIAFRRALRPGRIVSGGIFGVERRRVRRQRLLSCLGSVKWIQLTFSTARSIRQPGKPRISGIGPKTVGGISEGTREPHHNRHGCARTCQPDMLQLSSGAMHSSPSADRGDGSAAVIADHLTVDGDSHGLPPGSHLLAGDDHGRLVSALSKVRFSRRGQAVARCRPR